MTRGDQFWTGFCVTAVVAVIVFFAAAGMVHFGGREPQDHVGAVPVGVVELDAADYLIQPQSLATPNSVCRGSDTSDSGGGVGPNTVRSVPRLPHTLYVSCYVDQTWNATGPLSIPYSRSMAITGTSPTYWAAMAALLGLMELPFAVGVCGDELAERKRKRIASEKAIAERKRNAKVEEDKYKALGRAFAAGEITDEQLTEGIKKLQPLD